MPPLPIHGDAVQLELVLRNLIDNATDAVQSGPPGARRIGVDAEVLQGRRVRVSVQDSGPGVAAEVAGRLFQSFSSGKSSDLGLGLALSRSIIRAHGGDLWSEPGPRGLFHFILPLSVSPTAMNHDLAVYIVDDDAAVRDALGLLLGIQGYRIALFANGGDFLQAWRPAWAGCLLVDIRMPVIDGLTLQRKLIELDCRLPVVMMTGHGEVEQARQAFKANAVDFLEKPLDEQRLIRAIEEAFARQQAALSEGREQAEARQFLAQLTPREREVMQLVIGGMHNRDIGPALAISVRTVEVHKARLMSKLGVGNVADLVRISMAAGAPP